jgi:hypothetical protein
MKIQFRPTLSSTPPIMIQNGTHGRECASQKFFATVVRKTGNADHEQRRRKFLLAALISGP